MTPNEIAETILNAMMPESKKMWSYSAAPGSHTLLQITFRPKWLVASFDIGALMACFLDIGRQVAWQQDLGDETDSPRIVIQGGVNGTYVQAVFVLTGPED